MRNPAILVIDDDREVGQALTAMLGELGHEVEYYPEGAEGLDRAQELQPTVVLLDVCLPGEDGLVVLERIREASPGTAVIMISAYGAAAAVVKAMKQGASDFLSKPLHQDDVRGAVENVPGEGHAAVGGRATPRAGAPSQLERRRSEYDGVFENSPRMKAIKEMIDQVADTDVTVLIRGESGVGKELVARAIHDCSRRARAPFVKVNCAALPRELLESELFGYERGAFTGAHQRQAGQVRARRRRHHLPRRDRRDALPLQAKLLQRPAGAGVRAPGSAADIKVDVRVVASTNRDLEAPSPRDASARTSTTASTSSISSSRRSATGPRRSRSSPSTSARSTRASTTASACASPREMLERFLAHLARQRARAGEPRQAHRRPRERGVRRARAGGARGEQQRACRGRRPSPETAPPPKRRRPPRSRRRTGPPPRRSALSTAWNGLGLKEVARRAAREAEHGVIKQVLEEVRWNRMEAARRLKISYKALLYKIQECGL